MLVHLNTAEQKLAKYLALARYRNARDKNIADKKAGPQSNEQTDLNGIGAELAFCKLLNTYPDLSTDHIPETDTFLHSGYSVDVKSTKYEDGRLIAASWKKEIATDIYALMVGEFPEYRFVGLATSSQLLRDENLRNLGHGFVYALDQSELTTRW